MKLVTDGNYSSMGGANSHCHGNDAILLAAREFLRMVGIYLE